MFMGVWSIRSSIVSTIKHSHMEAKNTQIYMRILQTFSQMVLILSTFDMNWPQAADNTMQVSNAVLAAP